MILEDQVSLLRQNINEIRKKDFVLPLMGGEVSTKQAYEFKHLIHPARDIATIITTSDPGGNKLPKHLRGWDLDIKRGYGDEEEIKKLKFNKILNMVIHALCLHIQKSGDIDIVNDWGHRCIFPYEKFIDSLNRLVLDSKDVCLVICNLAEEEIKKGEFGLYDLRQDVMESVASVNLNYLLYNDLKKWPDLGKIIWEKFFDSNKQIEYKRQPMNRIALSVGEDLLWQIICKIDDNTFIKSWVNIPDLVKEIKDYFMTKDA